MIWINQASDVDDADDYDYICPDEYTHDVSNIKAKRRSQSNTQSIPKQDTHLMINPYYDGDPNLEMNEDNQDNLKGKVATITVMKNMYYE